MDDERRRDYLRKYRREWVANRRSTWLADKVCVRCGSKDNLEIDHVDPKQKHPSLKKSSGSTMWSWSASRLESELLKCQVLCRSCHAIKTAEDKRMPCGTWTSYTNYGCRCDLCKKANREKRQRYRAKKAKLT